MRDILTILSLIFLFGCSEQKKISKFIRKHGAKEVTSFIAVNYPEYLRTDTIVKDTTIIKEIPVYVKEIDTDTLFLTGDSCLQNFNYEDKYLTINIKIIGNKGKFKYHIKSRTIKENAKIPLTIKVSGKPCPTQSIIDKVTKDSQIEISKAKERTKFEKFTRYWFWVTFSLLVILILYLLFRFYKIAINIPFH